MNLADYRSMLIDNVCDLELNELRYLYVSRDQIAFDDLDVALNDLLDLLAQVKVENGIHEKGPDITCYRVGEDGRYTMEVGVPFEREASAAPAGSVKTLARMRCVGALLWGGLADTRAAYERIDAYCAQAGLRPSGQSREYNYYFESVGSDQNLIGIFRGIG